MTNITLTAYKTNVKHEKNLFYRIKLKSNKENVFIFILI